jgi:hypothetical protein
MMFPLSISWLKLFIHCFVRFTCWTHNLKVLVVLVPPKWELRSHIGVYLGHSPFHAGSVALVFNPKTGQVSPQYHVIFDNIFLTIPYMDAGTIPPNWEDLVKHSSKKATDEEFSLVEDWMDLIEKMPGNLSNETATFCLDQSAPLSTLHILTALLVPLYVGTLRKSSTN